MTQRCTHLFNWGLFHIAWGLPGWALARHKQPQMGFIWPYGVDLLCFPWRIHTQISVFYSFFGWGRRWGNPGPTFLHVPICWSPLGGRVGAPPFYPSVHNSVLLPPRGGHVAIAIYRCTDAVFLLNEKSEIFLIPLLPSKVGNEGQTERALGFIKHRREFFSWWHWRMFLILHTQITPFFVGRMPLQRTCHYNSEASIIGF